MHTILAFRIILCVVQVYNDVNDVANLLHVRATSLEMNKTRMRHDSNEAE